MELYPRFANSKRWNCDQHRNRCRSSSPRWTIEWRPKDGCCRWDLPTNDWSFLVIFSTKPSNFIQFYPIFRNDKSRAPKSGTGLSFCLADWGHNGLEVCRTWNHPTLHSQWLDRKNNWSQISNPNYLYHAISNIPISWYIYIICKHIYIYTTHAWTIPSSCEACFFNADVGCHRILEPNRFHGIGKRLVPFHLVRWFYRRLKRVMVVEHFVEFYAYYIYIIDYIIYIIYYMYIYILYYMYIYYILYVYIL